MMNWANSKASRGWVVRENAQHFDPQGGWVPPQHLEYSLGIDDYQRARLKSDLTGIDESTIQRFEVEK
jgi:hypothetical protein